MEKTIKRELFKIILLLLAILFEIYFYNTSVLWLVIPQLIIAKVFFIAFAVCMLKDFLKEIK